MHEESIRIHHGHNVKYYRKEAGLKQEALAPLVNLAQQTISRYESMRVIDDEILNRFAVALNVSLEDLKTKEDDAPCIVIENNNTIENNTGNVSVGNYIDEDKSTHNYNPIDKVVDLFERFLSEEKRKNDLLEQLLKEKK